MSDKFNLIMLSAGFEHGGNSTHRHFDSHPELFTYPTESMIGTPQSANLLTPAIPFRYAWPSFDSETTALEAYNSFYDEEVKTYLRTQFRSKFKNCGMKMNEQNRKDLFEYYCMRNGDSSRKTFVEAYFRSTVAAWENFNKTGKETHYLGYLPAVHLDATKFFQDFPDGKMIYVSRNPWSAYADTIKRPFPWSLEKYSQIWNVLQSHALICNNKWPDKFFILRYEDLVENPTKSLNELCAKLGISSFENPPVPSFNRIPLPNGQIYPWGTIKQATPEANFATAKELTQEKQEKIYMECGHSLHNWGYGNFLYPS